MICVFDYWLMIWFAGLCQATLYINYVDMHTTVTVVYTWGRASVLSHTLVCSEIGFQYHCNSLRYCCEIYAGLPPNDTIQGQWANSAVRETPELKPMI